ncbi:MAG: leucine-rich repeat domain-containing protein, partial [Clostridia bacterium]|nr:leucine-rich repeat domain-containing protein [Clostridia bacterium]
MKKRLLSTFLAITMMLSIIPALTMEANTAESSSVVSGELKQYISAISTSSGTTRLSVDNLRGNLNRKSSKAADYWLYADFTSNADEAITGIWIMRSDSLTTIDGYVVTRASVNVNSEGRACYIYYTKDKNAGAPIASVGVWQSEDDYFEYVTNVGTELQEYYNTSFNNQYSNYGYTIVGGDSTDLNADAGSKTAYVYLYYKRAPYVKTQTAEFCYDGQAHNGSVTVSDGAVVTYGTGVSATGTHTQTFKVTKEGMLPISGTTPVVISNHDYSVSLNNKVAASCKAAGHETDMKCSKCDAVKAGAVIPKLDHTYKNVICTVCGALEEGYTRIKTSSAYYKIDGDTIYIDGKGEIPNNAFKQKLSDSINLVAVTKAVIGDSITGIGMSAFYACKSLTSVTIPNSVKSIGPSAFCGCSVLTSVTIPNSVTSIGGNAFAACSNLTSVTIPNSVTSIGEGAFLQCSKLTSITIPGSVKNPAANIFSKCTSLKTVVIENGVTSISDYMFNACYALNSVTIPNTVTSIGVQAFYGTSLVSVTIPNSVTSLASNAFNGCSKLNQATLPCRLNYSFANGVRVTKVHVGDAVTDASKAPTCTENGLTEGTHCSVCGAVLTAQEVITASGHIWGSWNVWQEPSCTSTGTRGRFCERCYAEETEEIP